MDHRSDDAGDVVGGPAQPGEALEFVRFCHRRRHVGWPELYDEMCAVAGRGLYRGYRAEELAEIGIGLGLFQMPALAGLVARVVAEDAEHRRRLADSVRTTVILAGSVDREADDASATDRSVPSAVMGASAPAPARTPDSTERSGPDHGSIRLAVPAGA
jgi:hypothetical protein